MDIKYDPGFIVSAITLVQIKGIRFSLSLEQKELSFLSDIVIMAFVRVR